MLDQNQDVDASFSRITRVIDKGPHQVNSEPADLPFPGPGVQIGNRHVERIERRSLVAELHPYGLGGSAES
jgi:hypothetical protein